MMSDKIEGTDEDTLEGGRRCHVDCSRAAPRRSWSSPHRSVTPDLPILREAAVDEEAIGRVEVEVPEADGESEVVSVGGPSSNLAGCESESVTFEEAVGRSGLISETDTALDATGSPLH